MDEDAGKSQHSHHKRSRHSKRKASRAHTKARGHRPRSGDGEDDVQEYHGYRQRCDRDKPHAREQRQDVGRLPTPPPADTSSVLPTGPWAPTSSSDMNRAQIVLLSAITVVMAVLIGAAFIASVGAHAWTAKLCMSSACERHRKMLADCLNESVHPCHDFYGHVCSRWDGTGNAPLKDDVHQQFVTKVAMRALHLTVPAKGQTAIEKAAGLCQSCARVFSANANHVDETRRLLDIFGIHWPHLNNESRVLPIFFSMSTGWGWASVLQFTSARYGHVSVKPSSFFELLLRQRKLMLETNSEQNLYRRYFDAMVTTFQREGTVTPSYDQLMELEERIVPSLTDTLRSPDFSSMENIALETVVSLTSSSIPSSEWEEQLKATFNGSEGTKFAFTINHPDFFERFFVLVASQNESVMAYYLGWSVAQALSLLANRQLISHFYLSDTLADREHKLFCVGVTVRYVGFALYTEGVRHEVNDEMLDDVLSVQSAVQKAFLERLQGSALSDVLPKTLLDDGWLKQSLELVRPADTEAPDKIDQDLPEMGDNIFENIRLVMEYRLSKEGNTSLGYFEDTGAAQISFMSHGRFVLLPLALQKSFFGVDALPAVKYAILGAQVADAFTSVVFRDVSAFNSRLQLTFTLKLVCFFNRQMLLSQIEPRQMQFVKSVTSLRILLKALAKSTLNVRPARLRGYEALTDAQTLLIFWCIVHCGSRDGRRLCNDPVTVVDEFAQAFRCEQGAPMYSGRNCAIM
ncbi:hypothetical protein V5799_005242 [Amblyomma americanum]|uniref:Peptidase M13 N-terminal domain-containing protein n=1 Tax=Amblyomma americanum TaxID=6943 RepID=A0AAQ4DZT7_AMBAM